VCAALAYACHADVTRASYIAFAERTGLRGHHLNSPFSGANDMPFLPRSVVTIAIGLASIFASAAHAQLTLYVVRHGQTDWNREGKIQGGTDNPLNTTGKEQAAALGKLLADVRVDAVYTSAHQRARQTAAVFEGRAPVMPMDALKERSFGKFEGANEKDAAVVAEWNKRRFTWSDDMDGGESLESQSRRAEAALSQIREKHKEGGTVVVVAHGGINPLLVSHLIGVPPQEGASAISQSNDEVYRVELPKTGSPSIWKLVPRNKLGEL
jgi:2,3-bisphosphoglycerate-dependent phosphoglycerate mutase